MFNIELRCNFRQTVFAVLSQSSGSVGLLRQSIRRQKFCFTLYTDNDTRLTSVWIIFLSNNPTYLANLTYFLLNLNYRVTHKKGANLFYAL